jgi:hypothetical protein
METAGKMVVKQSIFGTGLVLNGGHELLDCGTVEFERSVLIIRSGAFSSNKITVSYRQEVSFGTVEEMQYIQDGKLRPWVVSPQGGASGAKDALTVHLGVPRCLPRKLLS